MFRGHKSSVDCAQYLTLDTYVSSGEDGSICLWKETQKRPISIVHTAHGMNGPVPHWISAMSSLKISDLFATGSSDGYLNFWTGRDEKDSLSLVKKWHIGPGFINGIALSSKFVILGIGSEHRLGRWERIKSVRNRVEIIKLPEEISGNAVNDDSPLDDNDSSGIDSDDASDSNSGGDSESEA